MGEPPSYPLRVTASLAGPASGSLELDLADETFQNELSVVRDMGPDLPSRQAFGKRLFEALFRRQQRGTQIAGAITSLNPNDMVEGCDEFNRSLKARVSAHRQRVVAEMKELARKTSELHEQIVANTPVPPGD